MKKPDFNILIVGVGGQGNILAGKIISQVFASAGYDVKQSEVHGMAQRGGAVSSHIRAGNKVYSPLIPERKADFIISFESLEILRYLQYASAQTLAIINDLQLDPPEVAAGNQQYPKNILKRVKKITTKIQLVEANRMAIELGDERVANSILMGALSSNLPIHKNIWIKAYKNLVRERFLEINLAAFSKGLALSTESTF